MRASGPSFVRSAIHGAVADGPTARLSGFIAAALVAAVALASAPPLQAQSVEADLSGTVVDPTGAAIASASVAVVSRDTGRLRTVTTDATGRYRAPVLPAGDYRIEAEAPGFGRSIRSVRLAVGQTAVVDLALQLASVEEVVLVVSSAPRTSSGLGGVVDRRQIEELPLNGRNLEQLAFLQPGVFATTNRNSTALYTHGTKINVQGAGARSNLFLLDGTNTADFFNNGLGSAAGVVLGVEAVREFRVLSGGYGAAYGGVSGGIVSVVTRSGGNRLQGSVFEFFRNDLLDARDHFDVEKPDFTRHQFGFSLGGPVTGNRTFFFGTGEGLYERLGRTAVTTVPSMAAREGRLPDPARPGATIAVSAATQPYLDLFPLPNGRDFGDGLAEHSFVAVRSTDAGLGQLRIDHAISGGHNLFVRYTLDQASKTEPGRYPDLFVDWHSRFHFLTAQAGQILGDRAVNTFRFGFSRTGIGQSDFGPRSGDPSLAIVPGRPTPQLIIGGMPNYGTLTASNTEVNQDLLSFSNELTLSRGKHLLRLGAVLDRYDAYSDYQFFWAGRFTFPSIQRFLQGRPSVLVTALPGSDPIRELTATQFGAYVQDELRVGPTLTLNLGLRWEFATVPREKRGLLVGLRDPLRGADVAIGELMENRKLNLAPRVAASWRPGEGRTLVSAAAGRFFDINTLPYVAQLLNNTPYFQQVTVANPSFPTPSFGATPLLSLSVPSFEWKTPEMVHYQVSVERELAWNTAVSVSYAGSRGFNLVRSGDINAPVPEILPDGRPFFPQGAPRRNPHFGAISLRTTEGRAWYDALLVSVRRRMDQGLQFQASYTLSHAVDQVQGTLPTEALGSVTQWLDPDNPATDKGLADFHRRHNLQLNAVWELPFLRTRSGPVGAVLGDWTVSGILTALSGNPFTPGIQSDYSRTLARVTVGRPDFAPGFAGSVIRGGPEQYYDPAAFTLPAPGTLGNVPRNGFIGPGLMTLDVAAFKAIGMPWMAPGARLQLRVEVFNALNRTNFGLPQRIVFAGASPDEAPLANAGRITTTTTSARQKQVALRLVW